MFSARRFIFAKPAEQPLDGVVLAGATVNQWFYFDYSQLVAAGGVPDSQSRFVVVRFDSGTLQKWDGSQWANSNQQPATSNPSELLYVLSLRTISPSAPYCRWLPPTDMVNTVGQPAFAVDPNAQQVFIKISS